jgi:hypothetical protein
LPAVRQKEGEIKIMGAKEDLLEELSRHDISGGTARIHDALIGAGLRYKGPSNSKTLLYYFRREKQEIGVAAMRGSPPVLSFPAPFWQGRSNLNVALNRGAAYRVPTEGFISPSQYSAGQMRISSASIDTLLSIVSEIIIPETISAGGP